MSQLNVRNALETKLKEFAQSKSVGVCWENIKFIPTDPKFLRATIFTSPTQDPSFGNRHRRYFGLLRVTYYTKDFNSGMGSTIAFVDSLVDYFPRGLQVTAGTLTTNITNTASVTMPGYEGAYMFIVVDIPYRADEISA